MTIQELLASDPSVSPAFSSLFGNPAPTAIDLEDTERRLSRAFDIVNSELPGTHFRNLQIARMKRKQAARETAAEQGIEEVA